MKTRKNETPFSIITKWFVDGEERSVVVYPRTRGAKYVKYTPTTTATINVSLQLGRFMAAHTAVPWRKTRYTLVRRNKLSFTFHVTGTREEIEKEAEERRKERNYRIVRWHGNEYTRVDYVGLDGRRDDVLEDILRTIQAGR